MGKYFIILGKHILYAGAAVGVALLFKYIILPNFDAPPKLVIQGFAFVIVYFAMLLVFERATLMPMVKKIFGKAKLMIKGGRESD